MQCLRIMRCATLLAFLGGHGLVPAQTAAPGPSIQPLSLSTVPASRLAHLRRGINTSGWFAQVYDNRGYTREHFQSWTTAEDIALIKSMGFDHVRLSVNPQPMMASHRPEEIPAEYLGYLDAAVKMILDRGLAVVIDLHPDSEFKARLAKATASCRSSPISGGCWRGITRPGMRSGCSLRL
ncbi:MAG: cellulase family glycosylhydrolase [Candidatus Sulfotelmatobacter sp.]